MIKVYDLDVPTQTREELIDLLMDYYTETEFEKLGLSLGLEVKNVSMVLLADRIALKLLTPGS
jgi:Na+-translocating ferredoxin:NAD+ oxidoreductase RnfE subunit